MIPLARGLRRRGFTPHRFDYPSRHGTVAEHAAALADWLDRRFPPEQTLYFVGHSLGGIVLRALAARRPERFAGRTVMLATPNQGSAGGDWVARARLGRWWLGRAGRELAGSASPDLPVPPGAVGILVGTRRRWCTSWLLGGPNDGLVRVTETSLPGAVMQALPLGHMGLMGWPPVPEATAHFLREGHFGGHGKPVGSLW